MEVLLDDLLFNEGLTGDVDDLLLALTGELSDDLPLDDVEGTPLFDEDSEVEETDLLLRWDDIDGRVILDGEVDNGTLLLLTDMDIDPSWLVSLAAVNGERGALVPGSSGEVERP